MDPHMGLLYPFAVTKFARNVTKNELNNKKTLWKYKKVWYNRIY